MDRKQPVSRPYVWQSLPREEVIRRMQGFAAPWWFAGGHAIDAFLGYESRAHGDIDIACFRDDHIAMQRQLRGLELWYADAPYQFKPWRDGEVLAAHVHDIWARESAEHPWCLQLMLDERDGEDWVYRRNGLIRRPVETLRDWHEGVPYLAVEVQLLYKSPGVAVVPKNVQDFENCLPKLDDARQQWLASALQMVDPDHGWLEVLQFEPHQ